MDRNIKSIFLKKIQNISKKRKFTFSRIRYGRNNKIILAKAVGQKYIIKYYSKRNIQTYLREKFFLTFFEKEKIKNVPKYLFSLNKNISVISFVKGKKIFKINNSKILHACKFVSKLNEIDQKSLINIPKASDSCFSYMDHINLVEKKINRLKPIIYQKYKNKKIYYYLNNKIIPRFNFEKKFLIQNYSKLFKKKIGQNETIISPSDFGFHNMLIGKKCSFLDFEYAGIDDAAKLICDFICQPDLQLNKKQINFFIQNFKINKKNSYQIKERASILLDMHRIKWCCVMLNDYLPGYKKNRLLAGFYNKSVLNKQLTKSILYFNRYL